MRIPQIFLPEKNLDNKITKLSKDNNKTKKPFEDSYLYDTVYSKLKCCLHTLNEGPVRIFWISDKHPENKYEDVEEMVNNMITESGVKLAYEIHDYYRKNFGQADIIQILDKTVFLNQVQIVYVDHKTTEMLTGGDSYRDNSLLFDHSFVITL